MTRIGLIGAGRWGRNAARTLASQGALAWVADVSFSSAAVLADAHGAPHSLVRDADWSACDAVWICTPIGTHEALIHDALTQNKHVLCEKPLALRREDAVRFAAMAKERGLTLMADHTWRGHAGVMEAMEVAIPLRTFSATRHANDARGFDPLEDLLPHDAALLYYRLGDEPCRVKVAQARPESASVAIMYGKDDDGAFCRMSYCYDAAEKCREVTVRGGHRIAPPAKSAWGTWSDYRVNRGELPEGAPEPLAVILAAFLEAIATGNAPRIGSAPEFIHVASVIEAAKQSRANGGEWVDV